MPLLGLSRVHIDDRLADREQVCPAGKQPNDNQSDCVQCPVGQATTTGACAACITGWVPVPNEAGDAQARCEVCCQLAPLLLPGIRSSDATYVSSASRVYTLMVPWLGVSRYVQLASSRTTTRATVSSALWAKPLLQVPALSA